MGLVQERSLPALAISLGGHVNNPLGLIATLLQRLRLLDARDVLAWQGCEVLNSLVPCRQPPSTGESLQARRRPLSA